MVQGLAEKLLTAADPVTGVLLYTFGRGTKLSVPLSSRSASFAVPGALRKFDPRGDGPAPIEGDDVAWEFNWRYGTAESWSTVHRQLVQAFGHFRPVLITKQDSDGTQMAARCRCLTIPGEMDLDALAYGKYTLTFEKLEDWRSPLAGGTPIYGTGLVYGTGVHYGSGASETIPGQFHGWTLTNHGDATEYAAQVILTGPLDVCFLVNNSVGASGRPYPAGNLPPDAAYLNIPFALAAGEYVVADAGTGDIQTNHPGVIAWSVVTVRPGQTSLFPLAPGANALQLNQASALSGGAVTINFHDRWR